MALPVGGMRLPVIGLTRRGDLKTKLAAFESGVDDILTVPFAPEELLARVIALVRCAYSDAVTFTPVIKLGELEIDIRNRTGRLAPATLYRHDAGPRLSVSADVHRRWRPERNVLNGRTSVT